MYKYRLTKNLNYGIFGLPVSSYQVSYTANRFCIILCIVRYTDTSDPRQFGLGADMSRTFMQTCLGAELAVLVVPKCLETHKKTPIRQLHVDW